MVVRQPTQQKWVGKEEKNVPTEEENKAIFRRYAEEVWNRRTWR